MIDDVVEISVCSSRMDDLAQRRSSYISFSRMSGTTCVSGTECWAERPDAGCGYCPAAPCESYTFALLTLLELAPRVRLLHHPYRPSEADGGVYAYCRMTRGTRELANFLRFLERARAERAEGQRLALIQRLRERAGVAKANELDSGETIPSL